MPRLVLVCVGCALLGSRVVGRSAAEPVAAPIVDTVAAKRLPLTFDVLTRHAVLVNHCRAEYVKGRLLGKVQATWKGDYTPSMFELIPPEGYVDVRAGNHAGIEAGQEFVVFWNRLNQVGGKLRQFNLVPIRDGKLSLVIDRGRGRDELTVAELRARVERSHDAKPPPE